MNQCISERTLIQREYYKSIPHLSFTSLRDLSTEIVNDKLEHELGCGAAKQKLWEIWLSLIEIQL